MRKTLLLFSYVYSIVLYGIRYTVYGIVRYLRWTLADRIKSNLEVLQNIAQPKVIQIYCNRIRNISGYFIQAILYQVSVTLEFSNR